MVVIHGTVPYEAEASYFFPRYQFCAVYPFAALATDPAAAAAWESLSHSRQRAHAEPVAAARTDETRERRVRKVLDALA